jgi:hypothetical protein
MAPIVFGSQKEKGVEPNMVFAAEPLDKAEHKKTHKRPTHRVREQIGLIPCVLKVSSFQLHE